MATILVAVRVIEKFTYLDPGLVVTDLGNNGNYLTAKKPHGLSIGIELRSSNKHLAGRAFQDSNNVHSHWSITAGARLVNEGVVDSTRAPKSPLMNQRY
jgi:hypothetical protein